MEEKQKQLENTRVCVSCRVYGVGGESHLHLGVPLKSRVHMQVSNR